MKLTRQKFLERCLQLRGATFITLTYSKELGNSDLIKPKANNIAGRIRKRVRMNCMINFIWENVKNRRLEKAAIEAGEGEFGYFTPGPRAWGKRIQGTPIVEHNGKHHLECLIRKVLEVEFLFDGKVVPHSEIEQWLKDKPNDEGFRDIGVNKIETVFMNGQVIELVGD